MSEKIPEYVARKIVQAKSGSLGKYFNPAVSIGGIAGAGAGFTLGMLAYGMEAGVSIASYLISGDVNSASKALNLDNAYKMAGEFAVFGSIVGAVITKKIKDLIMGVFK